MHAGLRVLGAGRSVMVPSAQPLELRWSFSCNGSAARGRPASCVQQSYRMVLYNTTAGDARAALVLDTGTVTCSSQSHTVSATALKATSRFSWAVYVQASSGTGSAVSSWSANASFFTDAGVVGDFAAASPVWARRNGSHEWPTYALLKTSVAVPASASVGSAILYITANAPTANIEGGSPRPPKVLAAYKAWVGGELIGLGPGRARCGPLPCAWGEPETVYDGFDVTAAAAAAVVEGEAAAVDVFVVAFGIDQSIGSFPSGAPKVQAVLRVVTSDGVALVAGHDARSWAAMDGDALYNPTGTSGCSWYYYPQEQLNVSLAPAGSPLAPQTSSSVGVWRPAAAQPQFKAALAPKPTDSVEVSRRSAERVVQIGAGKFFVDFGREVQGGVTLDVALPQQVSQGGVTVRVRMAEELAQPNGTAVLYPPRTGTQPQVTWALAPTASTQSAEMHEYGEFRYAELTFSADGITMEDFNVSAWVLTLPQDAHTYATLNTSNAALDSVWEMCRYTTEASSLDLYADSNARQRSADCMADDVTAMHSQWAVSDQLALQAYAIEQGMANGPASRVDWAILPIIAVRAHTMATGDLSLANATFSRLLDAHSNLHSVNNATGLATGVFALVDWPPGMMDGFVRSNESSIASAWVYYGAVALADVAALLGRNDASRSLSATAARVKAAMNELQFNGTAMCDGRCTATPHTAFHSTAYALALGAVNDTNAAAAWRYLRDRINPPFNSSLGTWPPPEPTNGVGLPCGSYPAQFAVRALYSNVGDGGDAALATLTSTAKNSWVSMLKQGATMTMEMWSPDEKPNLTWSHPWSASPAYIVVKYLFGIIAATPGFANVTITPQPGALAFGRFSMPTIRGFINVSLSTGAGGGGCVRLAVELPASVSAEVGLPVAAMAAGDATAVSVDGTIVRAEIDRSRTFVQGSVAGFAMAPSVLGPGGSHTVAWCPAMRFGSGTQL